VPPKVAIVTLTRNRRAWWANMFNNVTTQQWPISRLEWVIVDDSDEVTERLDDKVAELADRAPALVVHYVSLPAGEHPSIGAKRNLGVAAASADVDMFVMMDDDDYYPASSVATRASWLTCAGKTIAYCANIPMYDITRYISAINVSPLFDPPTKRNSEATMAFTRAAWTERPFPNVSMAEGEEFLRGRLAKTVEMPPGGIIVSFIHTANTSSRRVPADQEPNGCHYGFSDSFFRWLHRVGGAAD
jgi:glycosyltransferase involved in cell wall biosynthesis